MIDNVSPLSCIKDRVRYSFRTASFPRRHWQSDCLAIQSATTLHVMLPRYKLFKFSLREGSRGNLLFDPTRPGVGLVLLQPILPAQQISAPRTLTFSPPMPNCLIEVAFQLVWPSESHVTLFAWKATSLAVLASAT